MKYFATFPKIEYDNKEVVDITRRIALKSNDGSSPYIFYPYELKTYLRSDQLAAYYYDNAQLDWLIYLSNDIVDPYYGWYIRQDQLESAIIDKYGSAETAKKKIKYYMNNWHENAETIIEESYYNNNLSLALKKYWEPIYSENNKILGYRRKRVNHTMNTNMFVDYTISFVSGNSFTSGELVDIFVPGNQIANAEVVFSNSSVVRVQSISGNSFANSSTNTYIVGETSAANATANSSNVVVTNISTEEGAYWSPVYYYDYEVAKNEENKIINILGKEVTPFLINDFVNKMSNT